MKFWTVFGLFVAVFTVFIEVGYGEKTKEYDDFEEKVLKYGKKEVKRAEP